ISRTLTVVLSYGRDLGGGRNVFYGTLLRCSQPAFLGRIEYPRPLVTRLPLPPYHTQIAWRPGSRASGNRRGFKSKATSRGLHEACREDVRIARSSSVGRKSGAPMSGSNTRG